ncbi:hypothetical protein [Streptomyces sp. NPDC005017]|uniref:hypothetical protein n=1 Tax=Streptomyces sp. NPDC005017 TaxID=3364706 RepID=UPI0036CEC370
MSELLTAAAVIAPFVSAAATSMAGALVDSARTRLADSAVERGRQLLDRALRRTDDDAAPTEGESDAALSEGDSDAVRAIEALSPADREVLETAIGRWLSDSGDLSARSLEREIIAARPAGDQFHVSSHGDNSPAIGRLDSANFYFNARPDARGGEGG